MTTQTLNQTLLSPFDLAGLPLKNRVVMAALTRGRAGQERIPNALMAEYYAQRASVGEIVSEATTISKQANGWLNSPGIYSEEQMQAWKQVVNAVQAKGTPFFCNSGIRDEPLTVVFRNRVNCPFLLRRSD